MQECAQKEGGQSGAFLEKRDTRRKIQGIFKHAGGGGEKTREKRLTRTRGFRTIIAREKKRQGVSMRLLLFSSSRT